MRILFSILVGAFLCVAITYPVWAETAKHNATIDFINVVAMVK